MRSALLTVCACFGLGLGLTSTMPVAHACSCGSGGTWPLQLAGIDGEAEPVAEQAFWPEEGVVDVSGVDVVIDLNKSDDDPDAAPRVHLVLERVQ